MVRRMAWCFYPRILVLVMGGFQTDCSFILSVASTARCTREYRRVAAGKGFSGLAWDETLCIPRLARGRGAVGTRTAGTPVHHPVLAPVLHASAHISPPAPRQVCTDMGGQEGQQCKETASCECVHVCAAAAVVVRAFVEQLCHACTMMHSAVDSYMPMVHARSAVDRESTLCSARHCVECKHACIIFIPCIVSFYFGIEGNH